MSQAAVIVITMMVSDICPHRVSAMLTAVELDVDKSDFPFRSTEEARLWDELEAEFSELVTRIGRVWVAG